MMKDKTHCKHGHLRIPENLNKSGYCRICITENRKRYGLTHAAEQKEHQRSRSERNKEDINQRCREYRRDFPDAVRNTKLKLRYGITIGQRDEMINSQNNRCAICGFEFDYLTKARQPYIDHSHITNQVRGILCQGCNLALGGGV